MDDEKYLVVDVRFKDNSELKGCGIFNLEKYGKMSIQDENKINEEFKKLPWYPKGEGYINFQNRYINGYFHVENVEGYYVYFADKYGYKI